MGRKASDLVLLLGSRGKSRGRRKKSGLLNWLGHGLSRWLGGSSVAGKIGGPSRRSMMVPAWLALALMLAGVGGGILIRDYLLPVSDGENSGLHAAIRDQGGKSGAGPVRPGVLDSSTVPLTSEAFVVSAYYDGAEAENRERAVRLSEYLQGKGIDKARAYCPPKAPVQGTWCVVVYFSGSVEKAATRQDLLLLPAEDVPCPVFVGLRQEGLQNDEKGWPAAYQIK